MCKPVAAPKFVHRADPKTGVYRSFCPVCFQTVAEESWKSELKKGEDEHKCPGRPMQRKVG
jgi:hypothetical protein